METLTVPATSDRVQNAPLIEVTADSVQELNDMALALVGGGAVAVSFL